MRLIPAVTALVFSIGAPASAAPNAFWTFGFDLPLRSGQAPRFGEARHDERDAANVKTGSPTAMPGGAEAVRIALMDYDIPAVRIDAAIADYGAYRLDMRITGASRWTVDPFPVGALPR